MGLDERTRSKLLEVYEEAKNKIGDEMKAWNKAFQFNVEGEEFYVEFRNGELTVNDGRHPRPAATLSMTRDVLAQLLEGRLDAMAAFLRGKMKITGNVLDTALLRKMLEAVRGQ